MRKRRKQAALRLEQIQAQALADLGNCLSQARHGQNISLEQIAASTKIQRRLLEAIEAGQLSNLPEPVYVRGLLHRFAEAVGLSGQDTAAQFPLTMDNQRRSFWGTWSIGQLRPIHLYLLYILLICSAVNGLSLIMSRSLSSEATIGVTLQPLDNNEPESTPSSANGTKTSQANPTDLGLPNLVSQGPIKAAFPLTVAMTTPVTAVTPTPAQQLLQKLPSNSGTFIASAKSLNIKLSLTDQSWVRVTVDGENSFEGVMLAGTQQTWTADQSVTVRAGNAGGVLVAFNNNPPKPLGQMGAVEEVTYGTNPTPPGPLALLSENDRP